MKQILILLLLGTKRVFHQISLLTDSTLNKMLAFVPDSGEKDVFFGLGVWKEFEGYGAENKGIGHRGRDIAHTTGLWWFPDKNMSVVILVNSGAVMGSEITGTYRSFRKEIFETLLQHTSKP